YVGGNFSTISATARNRLAAIDTGTGTLTAFNPNMNSGVNVLLLSGTTLYAGGGFTTVNGVTSRLRLAALDTGTGTATAFDPGVGGSVFGLGLSGSTLYVGGTFSSVNVNGTPVTRNDVAAFDTGTSLATGFDANASNIVRTFQFSGSRVYVGG